MKIKYSVVVVLMIIGITACSRKINYYTGENKFKSDTGIPDYTKLEYWAAHPNKKDPSDSIPKPLQKLNQDKVADVFFLHPTTFLDDNEGGNFMNAKIDDSAINYKTDYTSILYQATAFNERAKIYAPRYRQAHISMYYESDSIKRIQAFEKAYQDIKKAFQYYLSTYNLGRPIIIASHSQGTTHAIRLVKEFFDKKELSNKLICAYLVGMGVKKNQYELIPICMDSTTTGCFVSWRTYREDFKNEIINRKDTTTVVVNPISWKTTNEIISSDNQKGAILYNFNKVFKHTQNAQVEGNVLWVSHPKFPGSILYNTKNYHAGDINLFYLDIREDVSRRINQYLSKNKSD
jgi:hypothetical protein